MNDFIDFDNKLNIYNNDILNNNKDNNKDNNNYLYNNHKKRSIIVCVILILCNIMMYTLITKQKIVLQGGNDTPILNTIAGEKIILPIKNREK